MFGILVFVPPLTLTVYHMNYFRSGGYGDGVYQTKLRTLVITRPTIHQQHHKYSSDNIEFGHSTILGKILIINIEKGNYSIVFWRTIYFYLFLWIVHSHHMLRINLYIYRGLVMGRVDKCWVRVGFGFWNFFRARVGSGFEIFFRVFYYTIFPKIRVFSGFRVGFALFRVRVGFGLVKNPRVGSGFRVFGYPTHH